MFISIYFISNLFYIYSMSHLSMYRKPSKVLSLERISDSFEKLYMLEIRHQMEHTVKIRIWKTLSRNMKTICSEVIEFLKSQKNHWFEIINIDIALFHWIEIIFCFRNNRIFMTEITLIYSLLKYKLWEGISEIIFSTGIDFSTHNFCLPFK